MRRLLIVLMLAIVLASFSGSSAPRAADAGPFSVVEATIPQMQKAMENGRVTSRRLVVQYLARIATYEDRLNAVLTVNPEALAEAEARDVERAAGRVRGPLHGIPIALKTSSRRRACAPRAARWRSSTWWRRTMRPSRRTCARPAPSSSRRPT
jgi:hypothetical protein